MVLKPRGKESNKELALAIMDSYITEMNSHLTGIRNSEYNAPALMLSLVTLMPSLYVMIVYIIPGLPFEFSTPIAVVVLTGMVGVLALVTHGISRAFRFTKEGQICISRLTDLKIRIILTDEEWDLKLVKAMCIELIQDYNELRGERRLKASK